MKPVYTPSTSDVINGSVVLTMEVTSAEGCSPATDQMTLSFAQLPTADAGTDMTVCQGDQAVILTASASNYTSISWTTSGTGTILNGNTLNPVYEPAATETGPVTLNLTAIGAESCGSVTVSDQMVITVNARITANAGADQLIPFNSTTMLEATATGGSGAYAYNWQPAALLYYENTSNPVTRVLTDHTQFIVLVTDLITGCQDTDTMMVNIDGINYAPVAENDYDTTAYNTSVSINILGNDSDPENGALTISFCGYPVNGLVVLNSNNTITYTPYEGFSGNDSICYQICDKGVPVLCDNAMVYIHVLAKLGYKHA
ncbi:MAG: cadherin-like domain-containing protein [Bacteroidales bacterium]|nr:cadherin-like domain-containing protein [Bacteroidales bacterium]